MKRILILYSIFTLLSFTMLLYPAFEVQSKAAMRVTLVEQLASASCGSCAAANKTFHPLMRKNSDKVAFILYPHDDAVHPDPMGKNAKEFVRGRMMEYYEIYSFPHVVVNGEVKGHPHNVDQKSIDDENEHLSYFFIDIFLNDINENTIDMEVELEALKDFQSEEDENLRLFVGLIEKEINYKEPPGTNGEKEFYHVLRMMLPDEKGKVVGKFEAGGEKRFSFSGDISEYVKNSDKLAIVAFVQNYETQEVHQAAMVDASTIAGVEENSDSEFGQLRVYPTEADKTLNVELNMNEIRELQMEIVDINGNTMMSIPQKKINSGKSVQTIDVSSIASGSYFLVVRNSGGIVTRKFIKLR